ncbi:hypothetical protein KF840_17430 [bacterium]|nr:hypothetical protein [bacterium]
MPGATPGNGGERTSVDNSVGAMPLAVVEEWRGASRPCYPGAAMVRG